MKHLQNMMLMKLDLKHVLIDRINVNPGLEEEYIFCFQVPKSFPNNFKLKFSDRSNDFCEDMQGNQFFQGCQVSTYPLGSISNPTKISYDSLLKTYVDDFKNMDANVSNIELLLADEINVLVTTISIFK